MKPYKLDTADKQILMLLQEDAKRTNKDISNHLGLSVTAVYERIKKLEREGVINGYVALLNKHKIQKSFMALCHIKLVKHAKEYVTRFESEIFKFNEVSECYHVSGDYDYIIKIYVENMEAYREFIIKKLTALDYIGSTHSNFVIGELKNSTAISL